MSFFLLFILGLLIGSFLNVVSLRYREDGSIIGKHIMGGRSKCRTCSVELKWYELIPLLSFIIQRGKCRHCYESLTWQYPTVEIIAGFITAGLPLFLYQHLHIQQMLLQNQPITWFYIFTGLWLLAGYTLVVISAIDLRLRIIPDQSNVLLGILGIIIAAIKYLSPTNFAYQQGAFSGAYAEVIGQQPSLILNIIIAIIAALALFGGVIFFTRGRGMGMGDLKLAIPLAILLSWPDAGVAFVMAFIIGAIVGILIILSKRATMKQMIPFGPFLALGTFVSIFYAEPILKWYFSLVS